MENRDKVLNNIADGIKTKQKVISNENSKFFYFTFKMRNLSDMNDFYEIQNVIILWKIIENRFEIIYNAYGFNPRKYTSAGSLSGCIERNLSKVVIALSTSKIVT